MQNNCVSCSSAYHVTDDDLAFYDKISPVFEGKKYAVAPPSHCPDCRLQRRLAWRNERSLHHHTCAHCQQPIISSIHPDTPYTVYCHDCWWSDKWDPADYAQEYDFSRPFFDQFAELLANVPKAGVLQLSNENSPYCHILAFSKNCYLCPGTYFSENCYYTRKSQYCRDCVNSSILNKCELVADSINVDNCYASHHLINCRNCSDSSYLSDCNSLRNCFMCSGQRNKRYHFKNQPLSPEEYEQKLQEYSGKTPAELLEEFQEFSRTIPKQAQIQINCIDSTGDYLYDCKNAQRCTDCFTIEDAKYLFECENVKNSMDLTMHDKEIQLCYELCTGGDKNFMTMCCLCGVGSPNSAYLFSCFYTPNCFGCDGLHNRQQHCILNKPYTKEEYEKLLPKIIEHMKETKEWSEFFPIRLSPYAYNETLAHDYFPLAKTEVEAKGWHWREKENDVHGVKKIIPAAQLPRKIEDIPDDILNWAVECEATKRPFKIIKQELEFYRRMKLPVPHLHPDERHRRRMELRNPRTLHDRQCDKCDREMQTTYAPDRPEKVYCEECYLQEVY